jgi:hypothetical protein
VGQAVSPAGSTGFGGFRFSKKPFVAALSRELRRRRRRRNDETTKSYKVEAPPITRLSDRHARIAATYQRIVDKRNAEENSTTLFLEPK